MNSITLQVDNFFRKKPEDAQTPEDQKAFLRECYEIRRYLNFKLTRVSASEAEELDDLTNHFRRVLAEAGVDVTVDSICAVSMDEVMDRR